MPLLTFVLFTCLGALEPWHVDKKNNTLQWELSVTAEEKDMKGSNQDHSQLHQQQVIPVSTQRSSSIETMKESSKIPNSDWLQAVADSMQSDSTNGVSDLTATDKSPVHSNPILAQRTATDSTHPPVNYLLALGYSEQISSGTSSVLQLSALALDFGAHLVEPTIVSSHIFGIEGVYPTYYEQQDSRNRSVKLFYMFDETKINQAIHSHLSPLVDIANFSTFLKHAPRNITIFHFNSFNLVKNKRLFTFPGMEVNKLITIFKKNPRNQILNCLKDFSGMKTISKIVEKQLNLKAGRNSKDKFEVTEGFCFNHDHIYQSTQLLDLIPNSRTIIFSNWGGCGLKDCTYTSKDLEREKEAMAAVPHIRHAVLTRKRLKFSLKKESTLHHKRFDKISRNYLKYLEFNPYEFISVHVRLERIVRHALESEANVKNYYTRCLDSLTRIVNNITSGFNSSRHHQHFQGSRQVLAMSDNPGSEFGTDTCTGRKCSLNETRKLHSILEREVHFQSFDPEVGGITVRNGGAVSLVEMHMLSMGRKLILVGYGGFQAVLKTLFLSCCGHNERDVYHVCNVGQWY